jgi:hypothetical protein
VPKVLKGLLVQMDQLAQWVPMEHKVLMAQLVLRVSLEPRVQWALKVLLEQKAQRVYKALLVL